jgi:hypothetical protein
MAIQANHRFTGAQHYVFTDDSAWNRTKINRELDLISGLEDPEPGEVIPWQTRDDHPVVRFRDGSSRFDIDTIRDYLLPGVRPTFVVMRRLSQPAWLELQSLMERESNVLEPVFDADGKPRKDADGKVMMMAARVVGRMASLSWAVQHGVVSIDDLGVRAGRQGLTDPQLDQLREQLGDERFVLLGYACLSVTRSLTPVESFR